MRLTPKKYNYIFFAILAVGIILLLISVINESILLAGAGFFISFASFIFRAIFFRCPYCRHYLGRRSGTYCPHCREEIR